MKKIMRIFVVLMLVLSMLPMTSSTIMAEEGTDIQNVQLAPDGSMSWDAFPGAAYYSFTIAAFEERTSETHCNVAAYLEKYGYTSGDYTIRFCAADEDGAVISTTWTGSYSYTSSHPQLATPENFVWSGNVVSWDAVPFATEYSVYVYEGSFSSRFIGWPKTIKETSIDITEFLKEGTYQYGVCVVAKADGYPNSEDGYSGFSTITKELPAMNATLSANGILSWDAFPGATQYEIQISSFNETIYGTSCDVKTLLKKYGKPSGEYEVKIHAKDDSGKQISKAWMSKFTYTVALPLDTPTNFVWNEKTVTWDPVEHATAYNVYLYRDSYGGSFTVRETVTEPSYTIPRSALREGTNLYGVSVVAIADDYPSSEDGISELHPITYLKASLQNVRIEDGVLRWDGFVGAKDYCISIENAEIGSTYTTETFFQLDEALKGADQPSGTYLVTLVARDEHGTLISTVYTNEYHYRVKYEITVQPADGNGTVLGSGTYAEGSTVTIHAYPNVGYAFDYWTDKWGCIIEGAGKDYSFVIGPSSSPEYTAWFKEHDHVVEEVVENVVPATMSSDGSYNLANRCKECDAVISSVTVVIPRIATVTLSTSVYSYNGKVKSPTLTIKDADGKTLVKGTDYDVAIPSGRKSVGTYPYTVTFKGKYSGSETVEAVINPAKPSIKSLTSGYKKLTVKMSTKPSSKGATKYEISYRRKGTETWKTITTSYASKTIKSLKRGKYYYIKVRAYKDVDGVRYYSAWTSSKKSKKIR